MARKSRLSLTAGWAIYMRVSDEDHQTPERSFAMQLTDIEEKLIAESNLPLVKVYKDILTGTRIDRAGFQDMLADAQAGRFSHLAIYRVDRFGRNTAEGLRVAKVLCKLGVHITPASNPSLDISTPDGWLMFTIMLSLGEHEVEVLSVRTRGGTRAKLESGILCTTAPDGYKNVHRDINAAKRESWVEINPERAPIVREAWDLLLTGEYSLAAVCEELDKRGYMRKSGKRWAWANAAGKTQYAEATLSKIFHNPYYAGWIVSESHDIRWGQVRSKAGELVSDTEWERAQQILAENNRKKRNATHEYLLQGMITLEVMPGETIPLRCATAIRDTDHKNAYYFLPKEILGIDENGLYLPAGDIESQIPQLMAELSLRPNIVPHIRDHFRQQVTAAVEDNVDARKSSLNRRLSELREKQKQYTRIYAEGRIDSAPFDDLIAETRADIARAQTMLSQIEQSSEERIRNLDTATTLLERAPDLWPALSHNERRLILRAVFREIRVDLAGRLRPSPLHTPFGYLADTAQRVTRVTKNSNTLTSASVSVSTCIYSDTPERT